jgi:hypothetical protein
MHGIQGAASSSVLTHRVAALDLRRRGVRGRHRALLHCLRRGVPLHDRPVRRRGAWSLAGRGGLEDTMALDPVDVIRRFEPILYFHRDERFFPSDAKCYMQRCAL